jgi:hypothetical protein
MQKVDNWIQLLNQHIDENRSRPFEWGQHDCGLWLASCLIVTTGRDFAADIRGKYSTATGAIRALKKAEGVTTPEDFTEARLGPRKPAALAFPGDGVAADLQELGVTGGERQFGLSLGICNGAVSWFVGETGLVELPTFSMKCAFNG